MEKFKIIGITGKIGSGKSHISEYIAEQTGFKLIKLDYQAAEVVNTPMLKQILQRRIKNKIPKPHPDIQLFPILQNIEKGFNKLEFWLIKRLLNKKLRKIIRRARGPIIVDFVALPMLPAIKKFDKVYLITSDENERLLHLARRDGITSEHTIKVDALLAKFYTKNYDYRFDGIITNDYQKIPEEAKKIVDLLSDPLYSYNYGKKYKHSKQ